VGIDVVGVIGTGFVVVEIVVKVNDVVCVLLSGGRVRCVGVGVDGCVVPCVGVGVDGCVGSVVVGVGVVRIVC
jgi:hypothetical protein